MYALTDQHRPLIAPAIVIGLALLLRLAWAGLVPLVPVSDSVAYQTFAVTLSQSGNYGWTAGQPTAYWPVGTALIYGGVYWLLGQGIWQTLIVNLVFGILVVILTMKLATIWFNHRVGIIAGGLTATWPVFIEYTTIIASEMIFAALLLTILIVHARIMEMERASIRRLILLGVLCGLAALVRPVALLLPLVLAIPMLPASRSVSSTLRFAIVTGIGLALVIGPWAYRNYTVFGEWVPVSTSGGANLWMGNNPDTTGYYQEPHVRDAKLNEAVLDHQLKDEAVAYIVSDPFAFASRTAVKAVELYERETIGVAWNEVGLHRIASDSMIWVIKALSQAFWLLVLGLFLATCVIRVWRDGLRFLLHPAILLIGYSTATYATFVIQDRYHVPTDPLMAILASTLIAGWLHAWPALSAAKSPQTARVGA
jgi:4-amino-4-deoxy-L-arabinose transferase-like glycosyltransferase